MLEDGGEAGRRRISGEHLASRPQAMEVDTDTAATKLEDFKLEIKARKYFLLSNFKSKHVKIKKIIVKNPKFFFLQIYSK